jgi:hypothetical protein
MKPTAGKVDPLHSTPSQSMHQPTLRRGYTGINHHLRLRSTSPREATQLGTNQPRKDELQQTSDEEFRKELQSTNFEKVSENQNFLCEG